MSQRQDLIGLLLNDTYRIERLIGEGGMGAVYEVSHRRQGRRFAIKLLAPRWGALSDEEAIERFRREAEVTRQLGHPNIVEVTEADQTDDGLLYFVMELLEGEDLGGLLRREGRVLAPFAAVILEQVASALEAAHRRGVVHRDLKPSNVFLCVAPEGPHVKVMDFSLSKVLGATSGPTDESVVLGTPWYLAPEQAQGRSSEVTPQTDIYAAGAILYRMVTGEPPFKTPVLDDLLEAIVASEPRPPRELAPELPAAAEAVILKALSKRPDDRCASMRELAESFTAAAVEDPFVTGPTDRWRAGDLKPDVPEGLEVTPPAERIDDLKTPPLERVAAGEVERAEGPDLRQETLPSVMTPEVEDAETIPALDPVVRPSLPSMRPGEGRGGQRSKIHDDKTDPDGGIATPTDPSGEPTDPDAPPVPVEPEKPVKKDTKDTKDKAKPQQDIPTVIVEPAAATVPEVAPPTQQQRRSGHLVAVAGLLAAAAVGIGLWLWLFRSPSPATTPDAGVARDRGAARGWAEWREVWLDSRPSGASVYAEGTLLGRTPLKGARVGTERVQLLLARTGYEDRLIPLEAGVGAARLGVVALERRRERKLVGGRTGTLKVITRSADRAVWADILLDGKKIGMSPAVRRVREGLHRIEARRPGFKTATLRLRVQAGRTQRVVLVLKK